MVGAEVKGLPNESAEVCSVAKPILEHPLTKPPPFLSLIPYPTPDAPQEPLQCPEIFLNATIKIISVMDTEVSCCSKNFERVCGLWSVAK